MGIGSDLADARRSMGMTVGQLSARTRIREVLIQAIERNDFSQCGGDFYARGHIRNIAKVVGLDPEAVVHRYDEQHGGVALPVRASTVFQADMPLKIRERRSPNWTTAMALALGVVVIFGVVRTMEGGDTPIADVRSAPVPAASAPPPSAAAPGSPRRAASLAKEKRSDTVVLQVKAKRTCWLDVEDAAGRKIFSGTLKAGKTSTWKAKDRVRVVFDDAGAVSLKVNGKTMGTPGKRGQTVDRSFAAPAANRR
ncbi:helix-turn-helix domain-containing protein [Streptosporangium sp. NPDC050855]|uniref:helix-turn-helix domain-containing protein n=1 Tax=Streptosporangium sp. NPDC050855 TaxID=3366194 RepID=UPI0037AD162A